ncbi:peptidylprolyl isomerase [Streptomyces sp. WAC06614]|uniref:peptidylprolyl isomerase n=1 Tax=Streptomyces sp. WAC06614 TaxID=2487416 RepID=UPI000F76DBA6|nr:peptidylprolyl isomerase [Streptomyces sp. WAC06614]RSS80950.1 peptidyl-prolyl cis-trans isomerase [Streptomyces sp. WAC06614]
MPQVKLTTNHGAIVIDLDEAKAPVTVANFLSYVQSGHYDGTIFHRVIPGFMNQGGGFTADMNQKPTQAPIQNEAANGLKNLKYTVAMARTSAPHSATSQFFINTADNAFLDFTSETMQGFGYAVFGAVTEGQDVVDSIAAVKTGRAGGHADVPVEPVVIEKAEQL